MLFHKLFTQKPRLSSKYIAKIKLLAVFNKVLMATWYGILLSDIVLLHISKLANVKLLGSKGAVEEEHKDNRDKITNHPCTGESSPKKRISRITQASYAVDTQLFCVYCWQYLHRDGKAIYCTTMRLIASMRRKRLPAAFMRQCVGRVSRLVPLKQCVGRVSRLVPLKRNPQGSNCRPLA